MRRYSYSLLFILAFSNLQGLTDSFALGQTTHAGLRTVAYTRGPTPDVIEGAFFTSLGTPVLNDSGEIAFRATIESNTETINESNDTGIWVIGPQKSRIAIQEGMTAPGTEGAHLLILV